MSFVITVTVTAMHIDMFFLQDSIAHRVRQ